jgi:quaternary ammonium compound-resistance protein SugE
MVVAGRLRRDSMLYPDWCNCPDETRAVPGKQRRRAPLNSCPSGVCCELDIAACRWAVETAWALALKASDGFSKLGPTIVFVVTLLISMLLLAVALRALPVGPGCAVWTGTGAVGAAIAGMIIFGEAATLGRILAIGLIAIGIAWLALTQ